MERSRTTAKATGWRACFEFAEKRSAGRFLIGPSCSTADGRGRESRIGLKWDPLALDREPWGRARGYLAWSDSAGGIGLGIAPVPLQAQRNP